MLRVFVIAQIGTACDVAEGKTQDMNRLAVSLVMLLLCCASGTCTAQTQSSRTMRSNFQISGTAFAVGAAIPRKFTCDGEDVSPALSWSGAPQTTKAFALIADDPDAPAGTWNHWIAWNIPASAQHLNEGIGKEPRLSDGARQGRNDFQKVGYNGPCPPPGKPHRYFFRLFALNSTLALAPGASRAELESAMKSHVVATAELMARYGRRE